MRISVRRPPLLLEDSFRQLRVRNADELRGRLTVQFQGEEGIDAGGVTREWYTVRAATHRLGCALYD
jgi:E3 ubiquitin-protein ligase HUWE1